MSVVAFKDLASSATKFAQSGQNASAAYTKGAGAAGQKWHDNTSASSATWAAGVQQAVTRGAYQKGVDSAGPSAYTAQIAAVGGTRFSDGISKAGPKWQAKFGKIAAMVSGKDLGPRGLKGSPANKQRAANMSDAWVAAKLA